MKNLVILMMLFFNVSLSIAQEKQFEVKKVLSPQFGKVPAGKTSITISDKLIVIDANKKSVEYVIDSIEETDFSIIYLCKYGSQNDIRFTYYKNDNYLKFENRDNFSGKVGELLYYFK